MLKVVALFCEFYYCIVYDVVSTGGLLKGLLHFQVFLAREVSTGKEYASELKMIFIWPVTFFATSDVSYCIGLIASVSLVHELFFSQSAGKTAHHQGKEKSICDEREGSVLQSESPLLH